MKAPDFSKVAERAEAARKTYQAKGRTNKANVLLYGDFGTGKTTMIGTAPKPIWLHSFDPGGTTTSALQPLIESGDIVVQDFSGDSYKTPRRFREWEREFDQMVRDGVFAHIGTFALDSMTKWADSLIHEVVNKGGMKNDGIPQLRDYLVQQMAAVDYLEKFCDLPCNVIVTGHIGLEKDEVTGKMETGLLLAGKLSGKVPLVFDEKWLTRTEGKRDVRYVVQTRNDGYYKAETRMGGGKFAQFEEPNFQELLRKAGRENAAADRPSLFST
jgi:hypothetical protein